MKQSPFHTFQTVQPTRSHLLDLGHLWITSNHFNARKHVHLSRRSRSSTSHSSLLWVLSLAFRNRQRGDHSKMILKWEKISKFLFSRRFPTICLRKILPAVGVASFHYRTIRSHQQFAHRKITHTRSLVDWFSQTRFTLDTGSKV